jgi:hypothetical protein
MSARRENNYRFGTKYEGNAGARNEEERSNSPITTLHASNDNYSNRQCERIDRNRQQDLNSGQPSPGRQGPTPVLRKRPATPKRNPNNDDRRELQQPQPQPHWKDLYTKEKPEPKLMHGDKRPDSKPRVSSEDQPKRNTSVLQSHSNQIQDEFNTLINVRNCKNKMII